MRRYQVKVEPQFWTADEITILLRLPPPPHRIGAKPTFNDQLSQMARRLKRSYCSVKAKWLRLQREKRDTK
jgi:hypothetical protein